MMYTQIDSLHKSCLYYIYSDMLKVNVGELIYLNWTLGRHDAVGSQQDLVWAQK